MAFLVHTQKMVERKIFVEELKTLPNIIIVRENFFEGIVS